MFRDIGHMRPTKEGLLVGGIGDITSVPCPLLEAEQDFLLRGLLMRNSFYTRHVTSTAPRRLGILGGTFDPPHAGHLAAAIAAQTQLGLDEVVLMVANEPWQKVGERDVTPAAVRIEMTDAMVRGLSGLRADDREIRRGGGPGRPLQRRRAEVRFRSASQPRWRVAVDAAIGWQE